jgi:arginine decarboxylase
MNTIRVVWGSATGPTAMSSFDAALAEAGVQDYNLITLTSVIPPDATVEAVGTAPSIGSTGEGLYCVQARKTLVPGAEGEVVAGLGWARDASGRGLFYEASGTDSEAVRGAVDRGLSHGMALRDWTAAEREVAVEAAPTSTDVHATAVTLAAYGDPQSLFATKPRETDRRGRPKDA